MASRLRSSYQRKASKAEPPLLKKAAFLPSMSNSTYELPASVAALPSFSLETYCWRHDCGFHSELRVRPSVSIRQTPLTYHFVL